jgi:nitrogen fixation/metabolism regulation signal transduction histidine kinase
MILFSRSFFSEILWEGQLPKLLDLVIFCTIPGVILVIFIISVLNFFQDIFTHRAGSKFQVKLLAYFILIVVFASIPITSITLQVPAELIGFWQTIDVDTVTDHAEQFVLDTYERRLETLQVLILNTDFNVFMAGEVDLPEGIIGIQDFVLSEETWVSREFTGTTDQLPTPPNLQPGFVAREMPRDIDTIRYVLYPEENVLRLISYSLGTGFDHTREIIETTRDRFTSINFLKRNLWPFLIFYYGVFFLPTILMTLVIAVSFTGRVTQPIVELTDATQRVAEGDFSFHIMTRQQDELGLLIASFNRMIQDLKQSQASLVKAEKISIWQSMAQQLAHEIKNPLTPIKLSAERVLRRWRNEPERIGEILESSMLAIIQETEGLADMLTEFRTLSRPTEPSQSGTKVRELVEEIIVPYRSSYPRVRFTMDSISADVSVKVDRRRLSQIVTNLIINGIDAMNGTGSLDIWSDLVKKRENRYCRLSIRDTGKGIIPEDVSQIFTPYFTTKESGTGLGLPIVERIVNDHGGSIWFNSAKGLGSTFFVDLPLEEEGPSDGLLEQNGINV